MAIVILATLAVRGLPATRPVLLALQIGAIIAALVGLTSSIREFWHLFKKRPRVASHPWRLIILDSLLAVGVIATIDSPTSPLAWVALIAPVLETAMLFSLLQAAFIWVGLSLAFLGLRIEGTSTADVGFETLFLASQQVIAVLLVSGPVALIADSTQQRIETLAEARRSANRVATRLTRVASGARTMSQGGSVDSVLHGLAKSAVEIGFDIADIVTREPDGQLHPHSSHSTSRVGLIDLDIATDVSNPEEFAQITLAHETHGDYLATLGVESAHGFLLAHPQDDPHNNVEQILRVFSLRKEATDTDLRTLALLTDQAREILHTAVVLAETEARSEELQHRVRHDGLTGLANRDYVHSTLENHIDKSKPVALFFLDLDGFKKINDTMGHRAGDEALVTVAERLKEAVRKDSLAGRMGGDEFIVITPLTDFDTLDSLTSLGESFVEVICAPMDILEKEIQFGASVGLAIHDGAASADQLINLADASMYEAKRAGGGFYANPTVSDHLSSLRAS